MAAKRMIFVSASAPEFDFGDIEVMFVPLSNLSDKILAEFNPEAVVFSLFGQEDDATLVVTRLGEAGFPGCCIVLTPKLPRPELIRAELQSISPALNIELFAP